ncbi:uncharacterized protein PGTG_00053 [Puccinia graminis f. sp. tritici CRL 75-36-700-3]|uniref:Extracellular membrane protein CFEM domain-containing protein n=1 Tax=Puccinia graminis f. sp. tritici (strain CRL 75-36-700-3 / race SCCL) TaxID=418459 RepID=E3JQ14_PUCGT|nr:uncharacterized protein PGTG_00053 [Puccinia graminis f. sp. tritici CRL 75-36-700-3]EFP74097.1 hypothetical protein PGTG_00053 [Puccinia graminis f. sp. tritici CRL 75-36-700-3]
MVMLSLTISLLATFQAAFAQDANANSNSSPAAPSAGVNSTGDASSALADAASKAVSAVANTTGSAINGTQSLVSNVTTPAVDEASCGSASKNINACLEHVHKDVSSCHQTDDTCLCQTYANLASCYNGCPSLAAQGEQYKSQSAQHCSMPGVAEKMKAAAEKNSTTTATATHHNTTSDNSNGQPKMSAKSAAFGRVEASSLGVSSIFSFALAVILA